MRAKGSRGVWVWSLALIAVGVVLLLNNFLLLSGFNVTTLWPLLLVILGAVILLPSFQVRGKSSSHKSPLQMRMRSLSWRS